MTLQDVSAVARDGGVLALAWVLVNRMGPRLLAAVERVAALCESIARKVDAPLPPPPPPPPPPSGGGGGVLPWPFSILFPGASSTMPPRRLFRFALVAAIAAALSSLAACSAARGVVDGTARTVCLIGNVGSAACSILTGNPAPSYAPSGARPQAAAPAEAPDVPAPCELCPMLHEAGAECSPPVPK